MNELDKINLGDKVKDKVTGYTGIAVSSTDYLQGCTRIAVQAQELKDGKPVAELWVDEPQLTIIKRAVVKEEVVDEGEEKTGGPAYLTPPSKDHKERR